MVNDAAVNAKPNAKKISNMLKVQFQEAETPRNDGAQTSRLLLEEAEDSSKNPDANMSAEDVNDIKLQQDINAAPSMASSNPYGCAYNNCIVL